MIEINEAVSETPELINEDPYGAGWLVKVKLSDPAETEKLLTRPLQAPSRVRRLEPDE